MNDVKLTPSLKNMLERMERGPVLTMALLGSGGRSKSHLRSLIDLDLVELCDHPKITLGTEPAQAPRLTNAGRDALTEA